MACLLTVCLFFFQATSKGDWAFAIISGVLVIAVLLWINVKIRAIKIIVDGLDE